jgi:hypothetical protein
MRPRIVQELASSGGFKQDSDRCMVGCGRIWIPKTCFHSFTVLWSACVGSQTWFRSESFMEQLRHAYGAGGGNNAHNMIVVASRHVHNTASIPQILRYGRNFRFTDTKDLLYGLLGLADVAAIEALNPDYSKLPSTVIMEAVRYTITSSGSLKDLRLPILNPSVRVSQKPRWAMVVIAHAIGTPAATTWLNETDHFYAAGKDAASITFDNDNQLRCRGVMVGTIVRKTYPFTDNSSLSLQNWFFLRTLDQRHPDTLWRTLLLDSEYDVLDNKPPTFPASDKVGDVFKDLIQGKPPPVEFESQHPVGSKERAEAYYSAFNRQFGRCVDCRCVFETDTGYIGIGPGVTMPGDVVAVLHGSDFPLVLEPVESTFGIVGDAYVHGIMRGELVDGSKQDSPEEREFILC